MSNHEILLAERLENVSRAIDKIYQAVKYLRENGDDFNKIENESTIGIYERYLTKLQDLQKKLMVESNELVYD